jgi:hypothetical protein
MFYQHGDWTRLEMQTPDAFNPDEVEVTRQLKIQDPHAGEQLSNPVCRTDGWE